MASGVSSEWRILFSNATKFGVKDPQFHRDIGFYVFRLPFLQFIAGWTFAALLVVLIITAVFHYLNGGIRLQTPFQRVTPQVKVHISVILALMALTKTVQYYLARFGLTLSHRGVVDGATYTDVKAAPALQPADADLGRGRDPVHRQHLAAAGFPIIAVGSGFHLDRGRHDLSRVIQRFVVQPNEFAAGADVHQTQHRATAPFGLDKITSRPFDYKEDLTKQQAAAGKTTLDNALGTPTLSRRCCSRPRSSSSTTSSSTSTWIATA